MDKLNQILTSTYPRREIKMGGDFCFLENKGLEALSFPRLTDSTNQKFYLGHFFTGLPKFSIIKMIIGFNEESDGFKWLCNPLFSDKYTSLLSDFNQISTDKKNEVVNEIVDILKLTGANITTTDSKNFEFQIWYGESKWRRLSFGMDKKIEIKTTPNKT